ncbi:hypothetical protein M413DRAFT_438681 [Hebeloma cylindrosporum]|uniref:Uncharacterized protein n=1 Tax=Hebeloma cylindrosporum TaxID=76867 RepID=A0A0C2Z8N4_HEBCY|nr:hypothetical protein M413DRAFT_438681 [Hebeloma cylindrosporum h7]
MGGKFVSGRRRQAIRKIVESSITTETYTLSETGSENHSPSHMKVEKRSWSSRSRST